jgi:hypothetical protein
MKANQKKAGRWVKWSDQSSGRICAIARNGNTSTVFFGFNSIYGKGPFMIRQVIRCEACEEAEHLLKVELTEHDFLTLPETFFCPARRPTARKNSSRKTS